MESLICTSIKHQASNPYRKVGVFYVPNYIGTFKMPVGKVALTTTSSNSKTGPIAVSTCSWLSCPTTCPLIEECYAHKGLYTRMHGDKVTKGERGVYPLAFCKKLRKLPAWKPFRHNVGGDLWHINGTIIRRMLLKLADSVSHLTNSWTYTHHLLTEANLASIREAIQRGFTINVSTEALDENKELYDLGLTRAARHHKEGLPVVCTVPADMKPSFKHDGVRFKQCPAQLCEATTCSNCNGGHPLCAIADRKFVVTFNLH